MIFLFLIEVFPDEVYTPPTMSSRTTSAPRTRTIPAERRRAVRVGAEGIGGGAVGLLYEAFEG